MMTLLLPDQVAKLWDYIKFAIAESAPPTVGDTERLARSALVALLNGKAQCWLMYEVQGSTRRFEAVVITQIVSDSIAATKSVLVYCLYGHDKISESSWKDGLKTLIKWAAARGCEAIVGYTENPVVVERAKQLGGQVHSFIRIPFNR